MPAEILTLEEQQALIKLENYFKHVDMSLYDRVFNALVIAEHELMEHCFTNEHERIKIESFKHVLNDLLLKISNGE